MNLDSSVEFWSDSKMPYVETRRACQSRICYKSHSHSTFSIGAVDCGISHFSSFFAKDQKIGAGSLVVIPAHVEHSCNPLPNKAWSYQMMHLDAEWLTQLLQELKQDILIDHQIVNSLLNTPIPQLKPSIINNPLLYNAFTNLNAILFNPKISILEKEQYLIEILTQILLPNFNWERVCNSDYYQQLLTQLLECIEEDIESLSLKVLSEKMNMSRYALIRLFKHYFGLTPHAYQLNRKVNYARKLLKEGCDIAQLAYELEFSDQSHFHRIFKQYTGVTPKQYAKN
ncbi:AraC family transcriptional regulator [Acinetobacter sp. P8-3-8]|uniref:helix-turn-helix domain-containing protein n=1 Tax=Acinetobacter sp. P8-3-8 TaxID=1029823 RepID=UPI00024859CE|nr:AraC family transcriptional regulator [Acinetobacter sp. P8-3-8]